MSWLSKLQFRDVVPYLGAGAGYLLGGPAGAGLGYSIGGMAASKKPSMPKYKPSEWETDYYNRLKSMVEGNSPLLNTENKYQLLKDQMQPEYERMQKEYDIYSAQRGIQGGPQQAFRQGISEDQMQKLLQARRQLEEYKTQLQMAAQQAMGQLGSTRSAAESQYAMTGFESAMQQYQLLQQQLADLMGTSGSLLYENSLNKPRTTTQKVNVKIDPTKTYDIPLIGTSTRYA